MPERTAAAGQSVATYRGQITRGETHPGRGEGERRGWRLIEVKYMAGNQSLTFTWRAASLAR